MAWPGLPIRARPGHSLKNVSSFNTLLLLGCSERLLKICETRELKLPKSELEVYDLVATSGIWHHNIV